MNTPLLATCETWLPGKGFVRLSAASYVGDHGEAAPLKFKGIAKHELFDSVMTRRMRETGPSARRKVDIELAGNLAVHNEQRALELAAIQFPAILADRIARSLTPHPERRRIVLGQSDDWYEGRITPLVWQDDALQAILSEAALDETEIWLPTLTEASQKDWQQLLSAKHPKVQIRELDSLDEMLGHPTPGTAILRAAAWFPTLTGIDPSQDRLLNVQVVLRRAVPNQLSHQIEISGASAPKHLSQKLDTWRRADRHGEKEWDTLIRFEAGFQDTSYQLALALADRMARGREFTAPNRLIATGEVDEHGKVANVEGIERKCELIRRKILAGDRVLLPPEWQDKLPVGFKGAIYNAGASCAFPANLW